MAVGKWRETRFHFKNDKRKALSARRNLHMVIARDGRVARQNPPELRGLFQRRDGTGQLQRLCAAAVAQGEQAVIFA